MDYANIIATQLNLGARQVEKTIELLEAGATVPFIARYRKEATGSLDDQLLRELSERRQILLFTCQNRENRYLKRMGEA